MMDSMLKYWSTATNIRAMVHYFECLQVTTNLNTAIINHNFIFLNLGHLYPKSDYSQFSMFNCQH